MFHKIIFKIGYFLKRPSVLHYYKQFQKTQYKPYDWQKEKQEKQLKKLINFVSKNVPYYIKLFKTHNINSGNIKTIKDLEKIPILTKQTIKQNWQDFIPKNINKIKYLNGSTGGSTGTPLKYRMSKKDYEKGVALLYRGWGYGDYRLGDKVAVIAGSSLIPFIKSEIKKNIQDFILNFRHYSSFNMSEENLFKYFNNINRWKPNFLRGYASSIYFFAKFIQNKNLKLKFHPNAIFTTSEKLLKKQRILIELIFRTRVFDEYGVNDGGISGHECSAHNGMHVDTERAIMETVNKNGKQIINRQGKLLATSLYNYALPFIRYDTGDLGIVVNKKCVCRKKSFLIKNVSGRVTDFLKLNNVTIGSPVLTVLMGKSDIEQYQIIQIGSSSIIIKIIEGDDYNKKRDEEYIRKSFYSHVGKIDIVFKYLDLIFMIGADKHKFIINKINKK